MIKIEQTDIWAFIIRNWPRHIVLSFSDAEWLYWPWFYDDCDFDIDKAFWFYNLKR